MKKVFLGGTINDSTWRNDFIPRLKIDYFNPVVSEWNDEAYHRELYEREQCDYCLYVLTPKMIGVYSIAELIDDSHRRPEKTLFCYLPIDENKAFDKAQIRSIEAVAKMVVKNGGKVFSNLNDIIIYLNSNR